MDKCKVCGQDLPTADTAYSVINPEGDKLYVVSVGDVLYLLRSGDALCPACYKRATWYQRQDSQACGISP